MNFDFFTVCDICGTAAATKAWPGTKKPRAGKSIQQGIQMNCGNRKPDAVIISTADFQHALHMAEAIRAGCDVYCEKPFAETMDDANEGLN